MGKESLLRQIRDEGIWDDFEVSAEVLKNKERRDKYDDWLRDHPDHITRGNAWSTIKNIRTRLKQCATDPEKLKGEPNAEKIESWIKKATQLKQLIDEFIQEQGYHLVGQARTSKKSGANHIIGDWFFYNYYERIGEQGKPKLTRNVLIIDPGGKAKFINNSPEEPHQYSGKWKSENRLIQITLNNSETTRGYTVYIRNNNEECSLLFGTFIAFNSEGPLMGFVVMEKVTDPVKEQMGFSNVLDQPHKWKTAPIPHPITQFLSYEGKNFRVLPKIGSGLHGLKKYNQNVVEGLEIWNYKHLGNDSNELYLSDPDQIIDYELESYSDWKMLLKDNGIKLIRPAIATKNKLNLSKTFHRIYGKKYFAIIFGKPSSLPFLQGMIEMAWALNHAGHAIIVYHTSDRLVRNALRSIETLRPEIVFRHQEYEKTDQQEIFEKINLSLIDSS